MTKYVKPPCSGLQSCSKHWSLLCCAVKIRSQKSWENACVTTGALDLPCTCDTEKLGVGMASPTSNTLLQRAPEAYTPWDRDVPLITHSFSLSRAHKGKNKNKNKKRTRNTWSTNLYSIQARGPWQFPKLVSHLKLPPNTHERSQPCLSIVSARYKVGESANRRRAGLDHT